MYATGSHSFFLLWSGPTALEVPEKEEPSQAERGKEAGRIGTTRPPGWPVMRGISVFV